MKIVLIVVVILGLIGALSYGQEIMLRLKGTPIYEVEEATTVTYSNLPQETKVALSKEDTRLILDLEFEFQREMGITGEKPKKEIKDYTSEAIQFITQESKKKGKIFTSQQINDVLKAEEVYLEKLGVLKRNK